MLLSFQNSDEISEIVDGNLSEFGIDNSEIVDLNCRKSTLKILRGEFPNLQTLDLRDCKDLEVVDLKAHQLQRIFLRGSNLKTLKIESFQLFDINLRSNSNIHEIELRTPNLEHVEFDSENISEEVSSYLLNIKSLKGVNHFYNKSIPKELNNFKAFLTEERSKIDHENCSCKICKESFKNGVF
jgi:uncharacterized protein YjbI with pentapeptide repeats